MTTYRFVVVFEGIDVWDLDVVDALAEALPNMHWGSADGEVHAYVVASGHTAAAAVLEAVASVQRVVGRHAKAARVLDDLVSTSDIASRTGVSRETVRLWANGERGVGDFPRHRATVGNGIKVWDWAPVNAWLREHYALGDPEDSLSSFEVAHINEQLTAPQWQEWDLFMPQIHLRTPAPNFVYRALIEDRMPSDADETQLAPVLEAI